MVSVCRVGQFVHHPMSSAMSVGSAHNDNDDVLSGADNTVAALHQSIQRLEAENALLQQYIDEQQWQIHSDSDDNSATELTLPVKLHLCNQLVKQETEQYTMESHALSREISELHALIAAAHQCMADVKAEIYVFQRDVIHSQQAPHSADGVGGVDSAVNADLLVKFCESQLAVKRALIDKYNNKSKLSQRQMGRRADRHSVADGSVEDVACGASSVIEDISIGSISKPIDYQQLKIKNNQYNTKVHALNNQLIQLKKHVIRCTNLLNHKKEQLIQLSTYSQQLHTDSVHHIGNSEKYLTDVSNIQIDIAGLQRKQRHLQSMQTIDIETPDTIDYVSEKNRCTTLDRQIRDAERKLAIMQHNVTKYRKLLNQHQIKV